MNRRRRSFFVLLVILGILLLGILLRSSCCKLLCKNDGYLPQDTSLYVKTISWNILFKDNVSFQQKEKVIENIKDSVKQFYSLYNNAYGTHFTAQFEPTAWCPCDSALFTISFTCVDGSGQSAISPPPVKGIGGKGDLTDVIALSDNLTINERNRVITDSVITYSTNYKEYNKTSVFRNAVNVKRIPIDAKEVLAILDSGIDTALFEAPIKDLIWKAPGGAPTLFNFIPHQPVTDFLDNGFVRHGSAVTAIAINAMKNSGAYPRLMILKALDKNDQGSTFSLSCALSYAIQNQATMVNASLGYFGKEDSVLKHYIALCANNRTRAIELFFAAGNTKDQHVDSMICSTDFRNNLLTADSLFFPGCFSNQFNNITTVTQISQPGAYCYYQYYSPEYVSLGVADASLCCSFGVDFRKNNTKFYEGSSFATPFASGLKMSTIISTGQTGPTNAMWDSLLKTSASTQITKDGKYIIH